MDFIDEYLMRLSNKIVKKKLGIFSERVFYFSWVKAESQRGGSMTVPGGGQYDDFILVLLLPPFRCSLQMEKPAGEGKRERERARAAGR